ncbi:MAG: pyruvate kinase [Dehalococcoidia bacterium]|nr:pyruvate kinase [Dehalococcoidia bacterium]
MDTLRRTKIVCTIGPASESHDVLESLVLAGMNLARLNFSHGTHQDHERRIRAIRDVSARLGIPVAILQDLPGPKIRTGRLKSNSVILKEGASLVLTTRPVDGDEHVVSISLPALTESVKPGDVIFLNDGAIRLVVRDKTATDVTCRVVVGGTLESDKGINVPGVNLPVPSPTETDLDDLLFGIEHNVDFIALSFVRAASDVLDMKTFLREKGADIPLVAKIEKREAWEDIDRIIASADGLMVARGDLGVEIPLEKVPLVQKEVIRKCNRAGKPVITATQMLESMVDSPVPTRAEVTDIANSIFDGTDAIMLSEETAVGRYPVEAVKVMARVALETEASLPYDKIVREKYADLEPVTDDAISYAACHTARRLGAAAVVAFTMSGSTARRVAKYRPGIPILAATPSPRQRRRLLLSWGVFPYEVPEPATVHDLFAEGVRLCLETGTARRGDLIVITAGLPIAVPGTTNLLKVERVE